MPSHGGRKIQVRTQGDSFAAQQNENSEARSQNAEKGKKILHLF